MKLRFAKILTSSFCFLFFPLLGILCSSDPSRIALWNAGSKDGSFGFNFCQGELDQELNEDEENKLLQNIKNQDFSVAFFLGSSDSYNFVDLVHFINVDKKSKITSFDSNGAENKSEIKIEDILKLEDGNISSDALSLFREIGVAQTASVWAFTDGAGAYHSENCMKAKSNDSDAKGRVLRDNAISQESIECSQSALVLCIAK